MFYYVVYNSSTLGGYSDQNKNYLTTFIYGTVAYIILHGLIHSYNNQLASYLKSYFWIIFLVDCASIFYLCNYLNRSEDDSLKKLISSFYQSKDESIPEPPKINLDNDPKEQEKESKVSFKIDEDNTIERVEDKEPEAFQDDDGLGTTFLSDLDYQNNQQQENEDDIPDFSSDSGSDIDIDQFEMSLKN